MNRVTLSYHRANFKQRRPQRTYCILMKTKSYACDDHVFLTLIARLSNCFTRYRPFANMTKYFNHCLAAEFKDSGIGLLQLSYLPCFPSKHSPLWVFSIQVN